MADQQPTAVRQITGDDIIAEILRNAEQGVFKIRYTALLPSIYHVYLHPSDYDIVKPVILALTAEARLALMERIDQLNSSAKPSSIARTLGFDSGKHIEYKILDPDWTIEFHPDAEDRLGRGEIEIYSELASAERPDFGEGAMTRHVTKRLASGATSSASLPASEATVSPKTRTGSPVYAYIRYEDAGGPQVFPVNKNQIVIGRGGKSFWVDLKLTAPPDVSREHCRIRRDPATGGFFLKDVSQFGTTIDGKKIPGSLEKKDGQDRDRNVEAPIPPRAVIGLADSVFLISKPQMRVVPHEPVMVAEIPVSNDLSRVNSVVRLRTLHQNRERQMAVISRQNCAGLSDAGRKRENNEDRFHADPERGIFFVIDGVGGQAAGEKAADTAYTLLRKRLERPTGTPAERVREAITIANNEIFLLAETNEEWRGMACVLTVAVLEGGELTIGQVGDSRLYIIEPGDIRKLTHDHSPVGEREDRGEIDELAAMRHPRRNEVYRDVGSEQHAPDDPDFIELSTTEFPSAAALLLCSDGLSDLVTSTQILAMAEQGAGEPVAVVQALIDSANNAGGKDNITVVYVEGDRFAAAVRRRSSATRRVPEPRRSFAGRLLTNRWLFLFAGLLLGSALAIFALKPHWRITPEGEKLGFGAIREHRVWRINSDISAALQNARSGDTVVVAPGQYHEQIVLKDGVNLVSEIPREATIRASGIAVQANEVRSGRFEGFRITGEEQNNLAVGIQLNDSNIEAADNEITNATTAAVECLGESTGVFRANALYGNPGAGIIVRDAARTRFVHNTITGNGQLGKRPGIEIHGAAQPVLTGNMIWNNAGEPVWAPPQFKSDDILKKNFIEHPATASATPARPHPSRVKPQPETAKPKPRTNTR